MATANAVTKIGSPDPQQRVATNLLRETLKNLLRNQSAVIGLTIIITLLLIATFAPLLAPYDPLQSMIGEPGHTGRLPGRAPCIHIAGAIIGCGDVDDPASEPTHIMGLDLNARDMFSRIVYGARTSLSVGIIAVSTSITVGSLLGLTAGFYGGLLDNVIMRLMDVLLAFPALLLAIAIVTVLGPGLENALLAIAIVAIPVYARLARASVLSVKEMEYVTAVESVGAGSGRILFRHIVPNAITPLIVQGTLGVGTAILDAAALSFIGLGAQPPAPEWGAMLSEARNYIFTSPHLVFFPGLAIMITVLGFNLLGDGLRDALDPRLNRN